MNDMESNQEFENWAQDQAAEDLDDDDGTFGPGGNAAWNRLFGGPPPAAHAHIRADKTVATECGDPDHQHNCRHLVTGVIHRKGRVFPAGHTPDPTVSYATVQEWSDAQAEADTLTREIMNSVMEYVQDHEDQGRLWARINYLLREAIVPVRLIREPAPSQPPPTLCGEDAGAILESRDHDPGPTP